MKQENSDNLIDFQEINFGRYLRLILLQSKMISAITLGALLLSATLYLTSPKTYKITSLLQIYSPQQSYDPRQSINLDFFNAPETNLNNLVTLYSSRSNITKLINDLNLNIELKNLEDNEILNINTLSFKNEKFTQKKLFFQTDGNSFFLLDEEKNVLIEGFNRKVVENENLKIQVNFSNLNSEKLIEITYKNPSNLYKRYKNGITVNNLGGRSNTWTQEGLIEVSFITTDINEGIRILDTANEIFINDNIKVETEKARSSILFIDSQLKSLEEILNLRKTELKSFKQENKSLNVNLEVESIIGLISDVEQKINKVDLELSQAEVNFTDDNPLFINLKIQKEALVEQKNNIEQEIENLPTAQQEYIDLFRNLEVSEEMYTELISRKLNFSLMEASSIGNIRIVDEAFLETLVGPRLLTPFLYTFFFFIIAILVALFRGVFFISISNPAELKDTGINEDIVGVISNFSSENDSKEENKFDQAMENLIVNLETLIASQVTENKECPKIVLTSPTKGNGKSFISRNVAQVLARIGNKVLLIDADLKQGDQHKAFNKQTIELNDFKNISLEKIDNIKVSNNLYLLPRLKKLKNTFEHLYSNSFLNKINELDGFFDYIVIDSAPALSVSDTGLLMTSSDINLLVVRHQLSRINEIKQTCEIINQIGRTFDGIIYNDYQTPKGYYGYYDLYGNYSYRYYADRYLYEDYYKVKDD